MSRNLLSLVVGVLAVVAVILGEASDSRRPAPNHILDPHQQFGPDGSLG